MMATKSEHRTLTESTSKGVNGAVDLHAHEAGKVNGFEENGMYQESTSSNAVDQGGNGNAADAKAAATSSGEISPSSLRRSTRACALKAAERIKLKETLTPVMDGLASHSGEGYISGDENEDEKPPAKKKRYAEGRELDQTDCKFGIKIEDDEVLLMSDESELSSLNEVEFEQVKKAFDRSVHREQTDEQKKEREMMVKTMEAELRREEAKLAMLRKLRISQQFSVKQAQEANIRKLTANVAQNGSGHAYKPPVAAVQNRSTSNSHTKASTSSASSRAAATAAAALMNLNLTPQQQQLLQNAAKSGILNTAAAQALLQQAQQQAQANNGRLTQHAAALATAALLSQHQQQQQQQQQHHHHSRSSAAAAAAAKETAAQRAAAAKLALRRQLEQQLLQIPPPRPPPPDMHFIPNGGQPDFLPLLGLDIAVQRLLKDKVATKRVTEGPYLCEECGTDFTPVWRAIGADENSLNLYCDACVKAAQKKKLRQEHTALLRKAFNKVMEKEQELEKQIAEGMFEPAVPSSSTPRSSTPATPPLTASALKTTPSSSGASVSTPKASTSSISHQQHHTKSGSHKRPAASSSNPNTASQAATQSAAAAAAAAAALAAAAGATTPSNFLQQQMAAAVALRQTNPMLAAMMANPLLNAPNMLQLQWNPLMQQRFPNLAMAALAQAVHSAQQSGATGNAASNATAAAAAAAANPLAALAASMNPAAAAAMFSSSPQMVRQLQQAQQAMQRSFLMEYAKSQTKK